jgi:hypothetical protein
MSRPDPLDSAHRARLGAIRISFLAGVLMFGAVVWFMRRGGGGPVASSTGLVDAISYAALAIGVIGIVVMRRVLANATTAAKYANSAVIGWSFGELAALGGGVHFFLTGDPTRYVIGVMVMLMSFVLIPLRRT